MSNYNSEVESINSKVLTLIIVISISSIIVYTIDSLEKEKCECSKTKTHSLLKYSTIIFVILTIIGKSGFIQNNYYGGLYLLILLLFIISSIVYYFKIDDNRKYLFLLPITIPLFIIIIAILKI